MSTNRLQVSDLDFVGIKENLKNFLKQQDKFQDYDFDGAGLNILLDILAYNTHYNSFYLNMVANESFLDTAVIRDSVVSHAKTLGYVPFSTTASKAIIDLQINLIGSTSPNTILLPRGTKFSSVLVDNFSYTFTTLEDLVATKADNSYRFENVEIYEGELLTYSFNYSEQNNPKAIFTLPNDNIDTKTITVTVFNSPSSTEQEVYKYSKDIFNIDGDSAVFFLQEGRNGRYEIYFGDGVLGKKIADNSVVRVNYLTTSGSIANDLNNFIFSSNLTVDFDSIVIDVVQSSSGGSPRESIDSIKYLAKNLYSTQNRLVTTNDYDAYLRAYYPSIRSISVWGGEENDPPVFGKVFASLNLKDGFFLSDAEKERVVTEIINPKSIVSVSTEIIEPDFDYLMLTCNVSYDNKKTNLTKDALRTIVRNVILNYSETNLNTFKSKFVLSRIQDEIDNSNTSIIGNKLFVKVQKRFVPNLNVRSNYQLNFNTRISKSFTDKKLTFSSFLSPDSTGVSRVATIEEDIDSFTGVSEIRLINPGLSYTSTPTITITGDGVGAEAVAIVSGGRIQSIQITKRGTNYTVARVSITGGGGFGASATAIVDYGFSTLRSVYFDANSEKRVINPNVGFVNYATGLVSINDLRITGLTSDKSYIEVSAGIESGVIESFRNTILTIDDEDPSSIIINL
jgi:hypothetical protein